MGKSQETFGKKEREKKRLKKKKDKAEQKIARREANEGNSIANKLSYIDEFGNLTDVPPDPTKKIEVDASSIVIGIPKMEDREKMTNTRKGRVEFFNFDKGYGFIKEKGTGDKFFVHINGCEYDIEENDFVTFELERGAKGMNAVGVKKIEQQ